MTTLPLSHITVLDLTAHRAGPTAVRQLADWGAARHQDRAAGRPTATTITGGNRHGFDFQNLHRNKQAMTLNLKSPEGHAIFMKLAAKADVIVENYRSDVKHRLEGRLRRRSPRSTRASSTAASRASARAAPTRRAPASTRSRRAWAG